MLSQLWHCNQSFNLSTDKQPTYEMHLYLKCCFHNNKKWTSFGWVLSNPIPRIATKAIKILLLLASSWLFEHGFSVLTEIKRCKRERLLGIDDKMRVSLSNQSYIFVWRSIYSSTQNLTKMRIILSCSDILSYCLWLPKEPTDFYVNIWEADICNCVTQRCSFCGTILTSGHNVNKILRYYRDYSTTHPSHQHILPLQVCQQCFYDISTATQAEKFESH